MQNEDLEGTAPGGSVVGLVRCVHSSVYSRAKQGSKRYGARRRCDRRGGHAGLIKGELKLCLDREVRKTEERVKEL